jgi:hypothetical protein
MPFPWLGAHVGLTFTRLFLLGGLALYEEYILVFVPRAVEMIHGNAWGKKRVE